MAAKAAMANKPKPRDLAKAAAKSKAANRKDLGSLMTIFTLVGFGSIVAVGAAVAWQRVTPSSSSSALSSSSYYTNSPPPPIPALCEEMHAADADGRVVCLRTASLLSECNIARVDARNASAYAVLLEHMRDGVPIILTHTRPSLSAESGGADSILASAIQSRTVRSNRPNVYDKGKQDPRGTKPLSAYLADVRASQTAATKAAAPLIKRQQRDPDTPTAPIGRNGFPNAYTLSYLFPGEPAEALFPNMTKSFGDGRVVIGGQVRFDHKAGGSAINFNGAFMGLPFHHHTSVLHEVVHGVKHFFFFRSGRMPPFGVESIHDPEDEEGPYHTTMHEWIHTGRRAVPPAGEGSEIGGAASEAADAEAQPDRECTIRSGETIYVPYGMTHATYNLAPSLSLVRSGCGGMIPSLRKEVMNPRHCPGPNPPASFGGRDWQGSDFLVPPPTPVSAGGRYPNLVTIELNQLSGTAENRDLRVKLLVLGDKETEEGKAALDKAQKRAAMMAGGVITWCYVPCTVANRHCSIGMAPDQFPRLFADARALTGYDDGAIDLGKGFDEYRLEGFLKGAKGAIDELEGRLRTLPP